MQQLAEQAKASLEAGPKPSTHSPVTDPGRVAAVQIIDDAVDCLCAICTGWRSSAGKTRAEQDTYLGRYKRELVAAFNQFGIRTKADVARGLAVARRNYSDFLPNPGKFAQWCEPPAADDRVKRLGYKPGWSSPERGRAEFNKMRALQVQNRRQYPEFYQRMKP